MLNSVTMHPQLVTHSRDLERSAERWKKMEPHDVIVESSRLPDILVYHLYVIFKLRFTVSRYSLVMQENSYEDDTTSALELDLAMYAASLRENNSEKCIGTSIKAVTIFLCSTEAFCSCFRSAQFGRNIGK